MPDRNPTILYSTLLPAFLFGCVVYASATNTYNNNKCFCLFVVIFAKYAKPKESSWMTQPSPPPLGRFKFLTLGRGGDLIPYNVVFEPLNTNQLL